VALHFRRTHLKRVVSARPGGFAYRVEPGSDGTIVETRLSATLLGVADAPRDHNAPACEPTLSPEDPAPAPASVASGLPAALAAGVGRTRRRARRLPSTRHADTHLPDTRPPAAHPPARKARAGATPGPIPA
jgi:hypothetical protein